MVTRLTTTADYISVFYTCSRFVRLESSLVVDLLFCKYLPHFVAFNNNYTSKGLNATNLIITVAAS